MSEPAKSHHEAFWQMRDYVERQIKNATQQLDYATRRLAEHIAEPTNRTYYEREVTRCENRIAYFKPQLALLRAIGTKHMFGVWELYDAKPDCLHEHVPNKWSGVECRHCHGWFCH